jgi:hypothetical protein
MTKTTKLDEAALAAILCKQQQVIARGQALACGMTPASGAPIMEFFQLLPGPGWVLVRGGEEQDAVFVDLVVLGAGGYHNEVTGDVGALPVEYSLTRGEGCAAWSR